MTIKSRLLEYLREVRVGQNKFEDAAGLSRGYINNLRATPGADKLQKIFSAAPSLNPEWLLSGSGDMFIDDKSVSVKNYSHGVPYYDVNFSLGYDDLDSPGDVNPEYLISLPGYERATLWCRADGHSMKPEIHHGDMIALQRIDDFSFLPYGEIYGIITRNGLRTIKRVRRGSTPDALRLVPSNPDYDEQDIPLDMITTVYRVLGAVKAF